MDRPQAYILVGVPNSGKTRFRKEQDLNYYTVLSTDDYIEEEVKAKGSTYNRMFYNLIGKAQSKMNEDLKEAVFNMDNIIWDQTNLTKKKRKLIFSKIPATVYDIHAVVFIVDPDTIRRRNKWKSGRNLAPTVLEGMIKSFEIPTEEEGFKTITIIKEEEDE